MTSLTKPKLILYLTAIFLAGGISGGFVGHSLREERGRGHHRPPSQDQMVEFIRGKLEQEVGITSQQWTEIGPIITNTTREIGELDARNRERIGELIQRSDAAIMEKLNDEQKVRMQRMIDERKSKHSRRHGKHEEKRERR